MVNKLPSGGKQGTKLAVAVRGSVPATESCSPLKDKRLVRSYDTRSYSTVLRHKEQCRS
jgi:hypothetical protein